MAAEQRRSAGAGAGVDPSWRPFCIDAEAAAAAAAEAAGPGYERRSAQSVREYLRRVARTVAFADTLLQQEQQQPHGGAGGFPWYVCLPPKAQKAQVCVRLDW